MEESLVGTNRVIIQSVINHSTNKDREIEINNMEEVNGIRSSRLGNNGQEVIRLVAMRDPQAVTVTPPNHGSGQVAINLKIMGSGHNFEALRL